MIKIIGLECLDNYELQLEFDTGEMRVFDIKPYLDKGVFKELKDENYFTSCKNRQFFIEWPHGQDLSTDTLYAEGKTIKHAPLQESAATY